MQRTISFKTTAEQYAAIKALADKNGMSAGQYCRMKAITESNIAAMEETQREMLDYQKTQLLDRETTKGIIEYLNKNMPKLVYDYFQAQRAARG
ncbi:hypothetical protein THICB3510063 [Thiomonas sp. CB3]|nr:hypothetical protein THICB3510063 [Thiomonas sp. CB3]